MEKIYNWKFFFFKIYLPQIIFHSMNKIKNIKFKREISESNHISKKDERTQIKWGNTIKSMNMMVEH